MGVVEVIDYQAEKNIVAPPIPDLIANIQKRPLNFDELQIPGLNKEEHTGVEFIEYELTVPGENQEEKEEINAYMLEIQELLAQATITEKQAQEIFRNISPLIELFTLLIPTATALEFCYRQGNIDRSMFPEDFNYRYFGDNTARIKEIIDGIFDTDGQLKEEYSDDKGLIWFRNHIDALAIRERELLVQSIIGDLILEIERDNTTGESVNIKSFGGGVARTVLLLLAYLNNLLEGNLSVDFYPKRYGFKCT